MSLLKKRQWLVLTTLLTLFCVCRLLPASWLIYAIQQVVPGFQVNGVSGTLWQGNVDYAQLVERGHTFPLGELTWQLSVFSLLTLEPCVQFSNGLDTQHVAGSICYAWFDEVVFGRGIDIAVPIGNIAPFFGINLAGVINASIDNIELRQDQFINVDASLLWVGASVYNGSEWVNLGAIQARFRDQYGVLISDWSHVEQADLITPVVVNISLEIANPQALLSTVKVEGFIKPISLNSGLNSILSFMGNKNSDGSYRMDFSN
ncbi:MAG: general secretion pathway protein N [Pseudohongiellaceae bacterium]|jgi:general secretion pathway protein N